jgi:curli biogenesis system outer membrane secretion channel CsgG
MSSETIAMEIVDKEDVMRTQKVSSIAVFIVIATCLFHFGCATLPGEPTAQVTSLQGPSVAEARAERYDGPKARIAVGDFQVKAGSGAPYVIGDGVREMLETELFNTNHFIVLDRQAMQDVLLEQDLGASGRAVRQTAAPKGHIEGAELLVYGVVSEFQMGSSGMGLNIGMPNVPLNFGGGVTNSHMAIDLRVVDSATARIVFAIRVEGKASDYAEQIQTRFGGGATLMPVALSSYQNTPMEKAIRVCINQAVRYLVAKTPMDYFHYQCTNNRC